jgi:molybdenum cofactor cytidylyltransferase
MFPAIVLAAGKSTRMGSPKALLRLPDGNTFLTRIVRTFLQAGVDDVVVVLGHEAAAIAEDFARSALPARLVENAEFESGQLSSLLAGLNVIDRPGVTGALVTLVDVPLVSPSTIRAVIERYRITHAPVIRPTRGTTHGHPLLIARSLFDDLRRANLQAGAKHVVRAHASQAGDFEIEDEGAFADADTPAEYEELVRRIDAARDSR